MIDAEKQDRDAPEIAALERRPDDPGVDPRDPDVSVPGRLRRALERGLADAHERASADVVMRTFGKTGAGMKEAASHAGRALGAAVEDVAGASRRLAPKWWAFRARSAYLAALWSDRALHLLGMSASATGDWLHGFGARLEHRSYRTGQVAYGGTFACANCGELKVVAQSGRLPLCARCGGCVFRRAA